MREFVRRVGVAVALAAVVGGLSGCRDGAGGTAAAEEESGEGTDDGILSGDVTPEVAADLAGEAVIGPEGGTVAASAADGTVSRKLPQTLDLAEAWQSRLRAGLVSRADLAREHGCTRARVTQILKLLSLHRDVLAWARRDPAASERKLRPLLRCRQREQLRLLRHLRQAESESA